MAEEDEIGGGVGALNDGNSDSGSNANDIEAAGGGGSSTGSSDTDNSTGDSDKTPTEFDGLSNEQVVQNFVTGYLALSAIGFTYEELVPTYVEKKLGFGKNGKDLKDKLKEENPDMDPNEIDAEVDKAQKETVEQFTEEGNAAKEDLKKKFDDLQAAMAEIRKNMGSIVKEFAKTTGEAFMPTTIGLGAPNPLSISLKLINGITKIKKILDRVTIALATFMALSKALGLEGTPPYNAVIDAAALPLKTIMGLINKQESDPKFAEQKALDDYLQTAKENWPYGKTNNINYKTVEEWGRDGIFVGGSTQGNAEGKIIVNIWPIEDPKDRQAIVETAAWYTEYWKGVTDEATLALIQKWEAVLTYNDYLGFATAQFKEIQKANARRD